MEGYNSQSAQVTRKGMALLYTDDSYSLWSGRI